jgi:NitT/TauT family transport system substrate-binding protein
MLQKGLMFWILGVILLVGAGISLISGCRAKQAPETTLTFLLDWKGGPYHAGFFVADAKGFYKDEKLKVSFEEASGAAQAATIIGQGKYSIGLATGDSVLMAVEKGANIISVATIYQRNPVVVFSLEASPITKPEDLVGKKVGIPLESIAYKEFLAFIKKVGLDQTKIEIVGVGFDTSPLLSKQVDALVGYGNNAAVQIEAKGQKIQRLHLADYGVNPYGSVIICNKDFLAGNRETVKRFVRAALRGWEAMAQNPDEAVELFLQNRQGHDRNFAKLSVAATKPLLYPIKDDAAFRIGHQYPERWMQTRDVLVEVGLIKGEGDLATLYTNELLK